MFAFYFIFAIFCTIADNAKTKKLCPSLKLTENIHELTCQSTNQQETNCQTPSAIGTIAFYTCKEFYIASPINSMECLPNGKWSSSVNCIPECGQRNEFVSLIMHGTKAEAGDWPWAAGLHFVESNTSWIFFCGATLVNDHAVITAAHCVWDSDPRMFVVTLGNIYRDISSLNENNEISSQVYQVKEILLPDVYQDLGGNYGSDIAVLILNNTVRMSSNVRPACLPWNMDKLKQYPVPGDMVVVAGWGLDENQKSSDVLKFIEIPITSSKKCIREQAKDFRKFITYTTFCGGYLNGTNVCNGDSGSGMLYYNQDKWELVGVVSVSPRQRGKTTCHKESRAVFTRASAYISWLYKNLKMKPYVFEEHKFIIN